jgi:hypothetical protein
MGEGSEPVPQQFDIGRGEMRRGRLDGPAKDGLVSRAVSPASAEFVGETDSRAEGREALADPAEFFAQVVNTGIRARAESETAGFAFDDFSTAWDRPCWNYDGSATARTAGRGEGRRAC